MKDHILRHCEKSAEHHLAVGKVHRSLAEEHGGAIGELHKELAGLHADHAKHFIDMGKMFAAGDPSVGTEVPTNLSAFGSHDFRPDSKIMSEEMRKRWFDGEPKFLAVAPNDESAARTGDRRNRLIARDGSDPRDESLEKAAPPSQLSHWFD